MSKYTLLRSNRQHGPYTLDEIARMGLQSRDLIWVEGKSASWRYPSEIDELKNLVPKQVEKTYNHIPLSRTRLQNDSLLLKNDRRKTIVKPVLSESEIAEFPTLARFFMSEQYEKQQKITQQPVPGEKNHLPGKKSVWVSMPSAVNGKKIVLIRNKEETIKKELRPILPPEKLIPETILPAEISEQSEKLIDIPEVPVIEMFETSSQPEPITENFNPEPSLSLLNTNEQKSLHVSETEIQNESGTRVYFLPRKDKRRYTSSVLQNLAVAVAVASLLMVGGLISYSVIYPDYPSGPVSGKTAVPDKNINIKTAGNDEQTVVSAAAFRSQTDQGPPPANEYTGLTSAGDEPIKASSVSTKKVNDKSALKPGAASPILTQKDPDDTGNLQSVAVNASDESAIKEEKKSIAEFVDLKLDGYKVGLLGGVKEFDVIIKNNSDVPLDLVVVELKYIQSNKKVYKTETLQFHDVAAQSHQSIEVPRSSRGVRVESLIKSIASREYGLGYNN